MRYLVARKIEDGFNSGIFINPKSGKLIAHTLELPHNDNKKNQSCIPDGIYEYSKAPYTPHQGKSYLAVRLVDKKVKPGEIQRTNVLFHIGNYVNRINPESNEDDTDGCILPGTEEPYIQGDLAIIKNSRDGLAAILKEIDQFGEIEFRTIQTIPEKIRHTAQVQLLSKIKTLEEKKIDISVSLIDKAILYLDNNRENIGLATDAASGVALKTGNVLWASILMMLSNILRPISEKQKTAKSNILQMIIDFLKWLIKTFTKQKG